MADDPTVLIVDDEADITETYSEFLGESYTVNTAHSGEAALESLTSAVDVVLLDRRMPGMSGDEVLEEIRSSDHDCRVVMITAVDPNVDIVGMEFDEYLVKPVTDDQLHDVVERMLARDTVDDQIQQMIEVASKLATVESKLEYDQLGNSEEYARLREEFESLRNEVTLPDGADDPYIDSTLEKIEALVSENPQR